MASAQNPLGSGVPPVRTKFADDRGSGGISFAWIKWLQGIYTFLAGLSFSNIAGKINISQINATGTPSASTFLRGDASWSPASGSGVVTGMQGDGVVYQPVVPVAGGILEPELVVQPMGQFLRSPATVPGPWQAGPLTSADLAGAIGSVQGIVDFEGEGGVGQDTVAQTSVAAPWVKANSVIVCTVTGGTIEHPETDEDAAIEDILASVSNIMPGSGFTLTAYAPEGSEGQYILNAIGVQP